MNKKTTPPTQSSSLEGKLKGRKVGLVLGCGAVAGAAWSIPVLAELERQLAWQANDADVLVGTSVGSVLATLLAAGVSTKTLVAAQQGRVASECGWDHDTATGPWYPPLPRWKMTGRQLLAKGLRGEVSPLTGFVGALPQGRLDMTALGNLVDTHVPDGKWVSHPNCWIVAVNNRTGRRRVFGRNGDRVPQREAVCASYGVPGWCPPITIEGETYIDGGVVSPTSADLLAEMPVDVVVILAPMASRQMERHPGLLARLERRLRRYMTGIVDRETESLKQAGKTVIRLEPGAQDLQAFGYNMMDPGRRLAVFHRACATAPETVQQALRESGLMQ